MSSFDAAAAFTATNQFVSHMQTQADGAIARLTDAATKWNISALSAVSNLSIASLTQATGSKPALLSLTLPTYTAADFAALSTPTLPTAPSTSGATAPLWSEDFWTNLKTSLSTFTDMVASSDDIDTLVNKLASEQDRMTTALFAKDYERKTQTLRDLYSGADAATGARGFSFPNSMTTALKLDAQQKHQFDLSEVSRTLITHVFEWAKSNWQFSAQQRIAAHNSDTEFNTRYLTTITQVYTAQCNSLIEKYRVDVGMAVAKAELKLKEFVEQVNTELAKQKELEDIRIKEAGFDLQVAKENAEISYRDTAMKIEDFKARVQSFLQTAEVNLKDRDANVKNQITAAQAAAQAAAALAAGASTITLNTAGA